jgi:hypothetical protein
VHGLEALYGRLSASVAGKVLVTRPSSQGNHTRINQRWGGVGVAFGWNSADALIVSLKASRR